MRDTLRILLCSRVFPPNIGGIETVSAILAEQWTNFGMDVSVVTETPGEQTSKHYEVVRQPSLGRLRNLAKHADLIFQNNISLRTLLPLLPSRKPVVIAHQGMIRRADNTRGCREYLKCSILPLCRNVAVSNAVAQGLPVKSTVIFNPFDSREFAPPQREERSKDLVFLGRLVSDKGCDLLLRAMSLLKQDGVYPSATIIGDGPDMSALRQLTATLGLMDQVTFKGSIRAGRGGEVAQHKIMVVPSIWAEPFGVVALEGLAAGCAVIASNTGGLPDAVGPCGLLFPAGDARALAQAIRELLDDPSLREKLAFESVGHLEKFRPERIARQYLEIFETALSGKIGARRRASA